MLRPVSRLLLVTQFVALFLAALSAAVLLFTAGRFKAVGGWVEHSHEVQDEIATVRTEVLRAGIALRNYLLVQDGVYLARARTAARGAADASERLEALVQDNPAQRRHCVALRSEVAEIVGWVNSSAVIAERDGPEALRVSLLPRVREDAPNSARQLLTQMENDERLLLQTRTHSQAREYQWLVRGTGVATAALVAYLIVSLVYSTVLLRRGKRNIETLRRSADRDPLTGLLNRRALEERFAAVISSPATVVVLDLDDFKPVNDTHGHQAGDGVLKVTATRLARECRDRDFVARIGGDEFALVLTGVADDVTAGLICARIEEALRQPILLDVGLVQIGASLGYQVTAGGILLSDLIAKADEGAYAQKCRRKAAAATSRRRDI